MESPSGRSIVNLDVPVSDIAIPVTSRSTKRNSLHDDERIFFENVANMIRYYT